tara:strand:+ start:65 stop:565 length:501 start_codon:yes stop_codon:yes gene_type:complete
MKKKSVGIKKPLKKKASPSTLLKNDLKETKDKYLRLYSEFENYRRRTSQEKIDMINSANKDLIKSILPIIDDYERAINSINDNKEDEKSTVEGFELIFQKLISLLNNQGVTKMKILKGDNFDSDLHEAITKIPSDKNLRGKIVDVIENGYVINDKVIRFAKVVTGS